MDNCLMMLFTAMSGIGAFAAIIVAILIYMRQEKIALFERRTQILNDFERFVFQVLPSWEWDGSTTLITKYSEAEVEGLFDNAFVKLQKDIITVAKASNILIGDIAHAKRNDICHDKTESELEDEKFALEEKIGNEFTAMRAKAYKKWLKL